MFLTLGEIIEAVLMSLITGWIFMGLFKPKTSPEDFIKGRARSQDYWFSVLVVAPSIVLHEMGHKTVAVILGLKATFHAAWLWLGLGALMKAIGGFIFLVPAFVSISGQAPHWVFALVSLAGPATNFLLYGISRFIPWFRSSYLKKRISYKEAYFWAVSAKINLFLGAFNLIPIPPFDGGQALLHIIKMF